jgi:hypothetical protein
MHTELRCDNLRRKMIQLISIHFLFLFIHSTSQHPRATSQILMYLSLMVSFPPYTTQLTTLFDIQSLNNLRLNQLALHSASFNLYIETTHAVLSCVININIEGNTRWSMGQINDLPFENPFVQFAHCTVLEYGNICINIGFVVVFNDTFPVTQTIYSRMSGWYVNDGWKECGKKRSWPNLRHYPSIFLGELRKITKKTLSG